LKINFKKVTKNKGDFSLDFGGDKDSLRFEGVYFKNSYGLVEIEAKIVGELFRECDICGEEKKSQIEEALVLYVSDSLYKSEEFLDVIEFLDGIIDFDMLFESEIESIKAQYFRCENCN